MSVENKTSILFIGVILMRASAQKLKTRKISHFALALKVFLTKVSINDFIKVSCCCCSFLLLFQMIDYERGRADKTYCQALNENETTSVYVLKENLILCLHYGFYEPTATQPKKGTFHRTRCSKLKREY